MAKFISNFLKGKFTFRLLTSNSKTKEGKNAKVISAPMVMKTGGDIETRLIADENTISQQDRVVQEINLVTNDLLRAIATNNFALYQQLCDPKMTCFEPESCGNLVEGLDFHRFYFDVANSRSDHLSSIKSMTILRPTVHVHSEDLATMAYVCLLQTLNSCESPITIHMEETRIWQRKDKKWRCIHTHRSSSGSTQSPTGSINVSAASGYPAVSGYTAMPNTFVNKSGLDLRAIEQEGSAMSAVQLSGHENITFPFSARHYEVPTTANSSSTVMTASTGGTTGSNSGSTAESYLPPDAAINVPSGKTHPGSPKIIR